MSDLAEVFADIQRIGIARPEDKLIFEVDTPMPPEALARMKGQLEELFGAGRCVVLFGVRVTVVKPDGAGE